MPEPTTSNRGYTIPNTGDLLNTWGSVINDNFTAIDSNISGNVSVTLTSGGTVTLSSTQAANLMIELTGTLSDNAVIAVPAIGSFWLMKNSATATYTVTAEVTGAPGTTVTLGSGWNLIYSDGTNVYIVGGSGVLGAPSGTKMLFQQTSAPLGWTKITTSNDVSLRVVSGTVGTGGATAFSSIFGSSINTGSHAITQSELPNVNFTVTDPGHTHTAADGRSVGSVGDYNGQAHQVSNVGNYPNAAYATSLNSSTTGISVASGGSGTGHTHTMSMNLSYVDVILASKD